METIAGFQGEWRWLSNMWLAPITDANGLVWPTSEHAYQAMKFTDKARQEEIRRAPTPYAAKRLGKSPGVRPDWNAIRIGVMHRILRRKFGQHPKLAAKLLATGDAELVEANTWGDRFWGRVDGVGENHLGRLLMDVRDELREQDALSET